MATNARIRASDADRDRIAAALGEHLTAGRLSIEEFNERLDQAFAAKTLGELDDLMADLPGTDLVQLAEVSLHRSGSAWPSFPGSIPPGQGRFSLAWRETWASWLTISLLLVVIWLAIGASDSLWFLWVALPLGTVLLGRWATDMPAHGECRPARPQRNHREQTR